MYPDAGAVTACAAFALLNGAIAVGIWRGRRSEPGVGRLAAGTALFGLALLMVTAGGDLIGVTAANATLAAASVLFLEGARKQRGWQPGLPLVYASGGVTGLGLVYFAAVAPDTGAQLALSSLFLSAVFLLCSLAFRDGSVCYGKLPEWCMATSVLFLGRAVYSILGSSEHRLNLLFAAGSALAVAGCSAGFVLMMDGRSAAALRKTESGNAQLRSELAQAVEATESLRERVAKNDTERSEFIAMIFHELRNPVGAILATSDLLAETELTTEQRLYVDSLENSAKTLVELTDDALDLARMEAGRLTVENYRFDLHSTAKSVVDSFTPTARGKGIDVTLEYPANMPRRFVGDAGRIRQVIVNLVGNALKFTSSGWVRVGVTCDKLNAKTGNVEISVTDSGIGIEPDRLASLFEKFVKPSKSVSGLHRGAGMGLVISKRLVELMGGQIHVESVPGKGSKFWFEMPLPVVVDDRPSNGPAVREGSL